MLVLFQIVIPLLSCLNHPQLCLKDRDLMAGLPFEHKAVTELISNRCRFVLPIFSPHFVNSEDNKFVVNFAEALGIGRFFPFNNK